MSAPTDDELATLCQSLFHLGLTESVAAPRIEPLTGGVSSDILLITTEKRRFCVKRALSRLKVEAVWEVPVERNAAEAAWLKLVGSWLPENVPRLIAEDSAAGLFAMEYLPAAEYPVWKSRLSSGVIDSAFSAEVGRTLCAIHRQSAGDAVIAKAFDNDTTFEPIRLEPYFRATALKYPGLSARINRLADQTLATKLALVHGDVSPKNILCGPKGPVFLDAECAWYGDPAFDLAFCLNHLLLKSVWHPEWSQDYMRSYTVLSSEYFRRVSWEAPSALEKRCAEILPLLSLGRVDGKSPVEYLNSSALKNSVRRASVALIENPVSSLDALGEIWKKNIHA